MNAMTNILRKIHRDCGELRDWLPYMAVALAGLIFAFLLTAIDAFEQLYALTRAHENWELDELLIAGFSILVALLAMSIIRVRREIRRRQHEEVRLHHLVRHDPLTGLPNRLYLEEELMRRIGADRHLHSHFAVAILHLEGIDQVVDLNGHQTGDEVLQAMAIRWRNIMGSDDLIARLSGNEFALIIADDVDDDSERIVSVSDHILHLVKNPVRLNTFSAKLTISLGVAIYPAHATERKKLLQFASLAAHQSRAVKGNAVSFYDQQLDAVQRRHIRLKADIPDALTDRQFMPLFQPLVCLGNGRLWGFEALARWKHPQHGLLAPRSFISLAEETGQISDIFWELLQQISESTLSWPESVPIAVNVSPVQLSDGQFARTLLTMLHAESFDPRRLVIEITENALVGDMATLRETMTDLKAHGVRFSLDDFGTGYSSLHLLNQLPFDTIKIDKSFVSSFHRHNGNYQIVSSIIKLCHGLGLKTTAEGVETLEEATELQDLGCTYGQGYLFSKPVYPAQATRIVERSVRQRSQTQRTSGAPTIASMLPIMRTE